MIAPDWLGTWTKQRNKTWNGRGKLFLAQKDNHVVMGAIVLEWVLSFSRDYSICEASRYSGVYNVVT
jgi:hypothetical protein